MRPQALGRRATGTRYLPRRRVDGAIRRATRTKEDCCTNERSASLVAWPYPVETPHNTRHLAPRQSLDTAERGCGSNYVLPMSPSEGPKLWNYLWPKRPRCL